MTLNVAIVAASPGAGEWIRTALESEDGVSVLRGTTLFEFSPVRLRNANVLVVEHDLPFEVIRQLARTARNSKNETGVVVVGVPDDHALLIEYIEHGLRGYVLESETQEILVDVVRTVAAGQVRLDSWLAGAVVERYRQLRISAAGAGDPGDEGGRDPECFDH